MLRKNKVVKKVSKISSKGKSFFSKRILISLSLVALLGLGIWGLIRSLTVPTDINLVATDVVIDDGRSVNGGVYKPRIIDENGCYYQPVQCVKAPCEPIKVCTSTPLPTTMPGACTRDVYLCPDGTKVGRTGPNCEFICPKPTSTPAPTCIPKPACLSENPVTCKVAVLGTWCESSPKPIIVSLTTFAASDPCGVSNFKSYQFSCSNGVKRSINDSCLSLSEGMKRAKESCQLQTTQKQ